MALSEEQKMDHQTKPFSVVTFAAKLFLGLILLLVAGAAMWTWATLKFVYSSGERAGYVQKISKKGWLFKTWEGELAMVNLPGAMPEKFFFSVRDGSVAEEIQRTLGQRVVLGYEEHKGIPLTVFGETNHFATQVHRQDDASGVLGQTPSAK